MTDETLGGVGLKEATARLLSRLTPLLASVGLHAKSSKLKNLLSQGQMDQIREIEPLVLVHWIRENPEELIVIIDSFLDEREDPVPRDPGERVQ